MTEQVWVSDKLIMITLGDITAQDTDAIVNAANQTLLGGGGVDGAIHRVAGDELVQECIRIKRSALQDNGGLLSTGQAVMTKGYKLPAKHVIHTVGPRYGIDDPAEVFLKDAYVNSLQCAATAGLQTIAFPSIGTGVYGCPVDWAASIAVSTIVDFLKSSECIKEVRLVLFSEPDYQVYHEKLESLLAGA